MAETLTTAQRVKIARTEAGWSQRQLAAAANIAQADLSRIESGRQSPTGKVLDRIMAALANAGAESVALQAVDGVLGVRGRESGKLRRVSTLDEAPPIEWVIEGFVARGAVTMIAGAPGAGKSMLTQSFGVTMAQAAAEGDEARTQASFTFTPGKVLVIDAENGEHLIQRRARAMGLSEDGAKFYVSLEADGFDLEGDRAALEAVITDEAPDLLILDSFTSLWGGSENSADAVKRVLNMLRELARTHNLGVLLIHHTQKSGDGYRGSSAIAATIEAVFSFVKVDEDDHGNPDRLIFCEKMRLDAEPNTRRVTVTGGGVFDSSDTISE